MKGLKTVVLSEDDAKTLRAGGFCEVILKHPDFTVLTTSAGLMVHVPGYGAVQMCPHA